MAWRIKWKRVRDEIQVTASAEVSEAPVLQETLETITFDSTEVEDSDTSVAEPRFRTHLRRVLPFAVTAIITATIATTVTALIMTKPRNSPTPPSTKEPATSAAVIMVQNKVALGASQLIDGDTPAYLSTQPIPFCENKGCKIPGTELMSGALLVAVCHVDGIEMFNYNLDSSESKQNPNRADSKLWYRAVFPDGRSGYISEVYIAPADRGGKGLPQCT
jgi:hypothetical protein